MSPLLRNSNVRAQRLLTPAFHNYGIFSLWSSRDTQKVTEDPLWTPKRKNTIIVKDRGSTRAAKRFFFRSEGHFTGQIQGHFSPGLICLSRSFLFYSQNREENYFSLKNIIISRIRGKSFLLFTRNFAGILEIMIFGQLQNQKEFGSQM